MVGRRWAASLALGLALTALPAPALADIPAGSSQSTTVEFSPDELKIIQASEAKSLVARYPPEDLKFYSEPGSGWTPSGWKKSAIGTVNDMLAAIEGMIAQLLVMVIRLLDLAWNLNLARALQGVIDSIATRFSGVMWGFMGLITVCVAAWMVAQVAAGAYSRLFSGAFSWLLILCVAALTYHGVSSAVIQAEDVSTEMATKILAPPGAPEVTGSVRTMTDGIYQQLILDNWARANFNDLETAKRYSKDGVVAGSDYWSMTDDKAATNWDKHRDDLKPWSENSIGKRVVIVFETGCTVLFVGLAMGVLALVVVGAKGVTIVLAAMWPVAVFIALLPWLRGLAFLKGYTVWVFTAPIVKLIGSCVLAVWMAFVGGIMDAAPTLPGGVLTSALIIGAFTVFAYFIARPFGRMLRGLVFKTDGERAAQAEAAMIARRRGATEAGVVHRGAVVYGADGRPKAMMWEAHARAMHMSDAMAAARVTQAAPSAHGHVPARRRLSTWETAAAVNEFRPARQTPLVAHAGGSTVHHGHARHFEYSMADLLNHARRLVDTMAKTAANSGGGRQ